MPPASPAAKTLDHCADALRDDRRALELSRLLGFLYDASLSTETWCHFLRRFAAFFSGFGAHLVHEDQRFPSLTVSLLVGFEHMPEAVGQARALRNLELRDEDPRYRYIARFPGKPMSCRLVVDEAELRTSRPYLEILAPSGIEYTLGVQLSDTPGVLTALGTYRGPGAEPFSQADCDWLGELIPHINRAFGLQRTFAQLGTRLQQAYELLDTFPIGIAICDQDGRLVFLNREMRTLIETGDGLAIQSGRLVPSVPTDHARLADGLKTVHAAARPSVFNIGRPSGRPPLHCVVAAVRNRSDGLPFAIDGAASVIFVTAPERCREAPAELLQRLFGLTPAEARLAAALVSGASLKTAAEAIGIKGGTARSYLKTIMSKTGTNRQADLVRLILTSPAWVQISEKSTPI